MRQVYDTLTSAGYRNITEIELEHGRYDVKADNPQGQRVKLRVDAQNGAAAQPPEGLRRRFPGRAAPAQRRPAPSPALP